MNNPAIHFHLSNLNLHWIPDQYYLQKQFKMLLKQYHPDRNKTGRKLAHEKTIQLIRSYKSIKDYIRNHPITELDRNKLSDEDNKPLSERSYYRGEKNNHSSIFLQLIDSPSGNYALYIDNIIQIIFWKDASVINTSSGSYYDYKKKLYRLHSIVGESFLNEEAEYIILYKTETTNYGIVLSKDMQFSRIEEVNSCELIFSSNVKDVSGWVFMRNKQYFIPKKLVDSI